MDSVAEPVMVVTVTVDDEISVYYQVSAEPVMVVTVTVDDEISVYYQVSRKVTGHPLQKVITRSVCT